MVPNLLEFALLAHGATISGRMGFDLHSCRPKERVDLGSKPSAMGSASLLYYVFDVLVLAGKGDTQKALDERRAQLTERVLTKLSDPVRQAPVLEGSPRDDQ